MFTLIALILIVALLASSSNQAAQIRDLQKANGITPNDGIGPLGYLFAGLIFLGILAAAFV